MKLQEPIIVKTYTSFDEIVDKRNQWDDFIESINGEIFLTFDWCRIWWKYYGSKRELAIYIFFKDGEICAILPLFREKLWIGPIPISVIKIVGTDYSTVTFTIPIRTTCINEVVDVIFPEINLRWRWDLLYIGAICGRCDSTAAFITAINGKLHNTHRCQMKLSDVQTYFPVADDWENQLSYLSRKQRTNARRAFRDAEREKVEIEYVHASSKEDVESMLIKFIQMHQKHWRSIGMAGHFGAWPASIEFHKEVAEVLQKLDRLRLIEIQFNKRPMAYEYLYRFSNTYFWFLNARADDIEKIRFDYKWIGFYAKIEAAQKDHVKTIDGMRGKYDYKRLMGGEEKPISNIYIYSAKFPALQRIVFFRLLAKVLTILYYKIWRNRLAPRLGIQVKTFWENWVRFHILST